MTEQANNEAQQPQASRQIVDSLERVWDEIKQISRQVEEETRKTGRAARLKLDIRKLEREVSEVQSRLGQAVYAARHEHGDGIALSEVEGFAGGVAALDALHEKLTAKQAEIDALHRPADSPLQESEEVA
jgi:uncharacterized protein Yka (UPF0111/DUF47 family)